MTLPNQKQDIPNHRINNNIAVPIVPNQPLDDEKAIESPMRSQKQVIPPPLELLTEEKMADSTTHRVDGIVSSLPFEEEEVESGHIMDAQQIENVGNTMRTVNQSDSTVSTNAVIPALPVPVSKDHVNGGSNINTAANSSNFEGSHHSNTSNSTNQCSHSLNQCIPCNPTNNPNNGTFDPLSYKLAPNGRLMEDKEEWERRPKVTINENGEMVYRPLRMQCTHCDEAYTKTHDLYAHIRTHQRHTECPHCGKILTCMATFVYHVRTHTMEKPYYCPVDGCDFKNAVKYNLKVHLACIRHGGKANLAKYAKVLDLDVCDKSLRKRKDNSVHELGSRRSKKRRKLNNGSSSRSDRSGGRGHGHGHDHGVSACSMSMQNPIFGGYYGQTQEEYDQFAAQLLFSLSAYQNAANYGQSQQMYDPNAMQMDWTQNMNALNTLKGNLNANQVDQQPVVDQNGNMVPPLPLDAVKGEQNHLLLDAMNGINPMNNMNVNGEYMMLKPEQMYDPNYGYYAYPNAMNVNVNLASYPTTRQLTSKDSINSKVSAGTVSTVSPKDATNEQNQNAADSNSNENQQNEHKEKDSEKAAPQETSTAIIPKQEIVETEPMHSSYEMMQQMQAPVMLMQQDPATGAMNPMMMQHHPHYEHALAAQYMNNVMAPSYGLQYPYGLMYGDPTMVSPSNAQQQMQQQQIQQMQMQQMHQQMETDKKIEAPPLPINIQYLEPSGATEQSHQTQ